MRRRDLPQDPITAAAHLVTLHRRLADQAVEGFILALRDAGDHDGAAEWYPVLQAVDEMLREVRKEGEAQH